MGVRAGIPYKGVPIILITLSLSLLASSLVAIGIWLFQLHISFSELPIPQVEQVLLNLIAALALSRAKKLYWTIAWASLSLSLFITIFETLSGGSGFFEQAGVVVSVFAIGGVIFYFRWPYIDRRSKFFSISDRLEVAVPVAIKHPVQATATITNLSMSGAVIRCKPSTQLDLKSEVTFQPEGSSFEIHAIVARHVQNDFAVKFRRISPEVKSWLESKLKKRAIE